MKNILIIIPYGGVGGIEKLSKYFYDQLTADGHQVKVLKIIKLNEDLISFDDDELHLLQKDFSELSTIERLLFYFKAPLKVREIISRERINLTISMGDMPNLFNSLTLTKEKKIGSVHSHKSYDLKNKSTWNTLTKIGYKSSYGKFDKCVCISRTVLKDLKENFNYPFDNLEVIYNPHNLELIRSLGKESIDNYPILKENDYLIFVGRASEPKALWHLFRCFRNLNDRHPNLQLVFVGDGADDYMLKIKNFLRLLQIENRVHLLGRQENPYKFIKNSRFLVLSSIYEGTPNVLIEALALKIPVVTSLSTKGIFEIMNIAEIESNSEIIISDYGIISPSFPITNENIWSVEKEMTLEESKFLEGMEEALKIDSFYEDDRTLDKHLAKFDVKKVINSYLKFDL